MVERSGHPIPISARMNDYDNDDSDAARLVVEGSKHIRDALRETEEQSEARMAREGEAT